MASDYYDFVGAYEGEDHHPTLQLQASPSSPDSVVQATAITAQISGDVYGRLESSSDRFPHPDSAPEAGRDTGRANLEATGSPKQRGHEDDERDSFIHRIYLDRAVWPLKDPEEAGLFRHFIQKLAIWVSMPPCQKVSP